MTDAAALGVGETLARARQTQGLELSDVAQLLKFAPRQLEALEQERFDALPGPTIARGMVRNYARLMKLDPDPLLERMADRFAPQDAAQLAARFTQPVPFSNGGRSSTWLYLCLSVGVLLVVGFVAYQWHRESGAPAPAVAASEAPVAASEPARNIPVLPAQTASTPAQTSAVVAPVPVPAPAAVKEAQVLTKSMRGSSRLVLVCDQEAWIEVRDAEERLLVSALNPAGTERVVQGRGPFTLVIGNAQHVRVRYNDQPVDLAPHTKVEVARLTLK